MGKAPSMPNFKQCVAKQKVSEITSSIPSVIALIYLSSL